MPPNGLHYICKKKNGVYYMETGKLTPFEKIEAALIENAAWRAMLIATDDLIKISLEIEKETDASAVNEKSVISDLAVVTLAKTMEERFGISA